MSLRSPLGRVLGLGSAKDGTSHWWAQRMTAVALSFLSTWFLISVLLLDNLQFDVVSAWVGKPLNSMRTECRRQAHQSSLAPRGFAAVLGRVVWGPAFVTRVEWTRTVRKSASGLRPDP